MNQCLGTGCIERGFRNCSSQSDSLSVKWAQQHPSVLAHPPTPSPSLAQSTLPLPLALNHGNWDVQASVSEQPIVLTVRLQQAPPTTSSDVLIRFGDTTGIQWGRCSRDAAEIRYFSITIGNGLHVALVMQTAYLLFPSCCPIWSLPVIDGHRRGESTHLPLTLASPLDFYLQSELAPSACCNNSRLWKASRTKDIQTVTSPVFQAQGSP